MFVALTVKLYVPACASEDEVTVIVVEAEFPGEIVKLFDDKEQLHPDGQLTTDKLNVDDPHAELSLLVTVTV